LKYNNYRIENIQRSNLTNIWWRWNWTSN